MLCTVFVTYRAGEKLPVDEIKGNPHLGWLLVDQDSRKVTPREAARLYRNEGMHLEMIEPMINVRVRVKRGGLLISGEEEQRGYQAPTLRQSWWCVPAAPAALTEAS